MTNGLHIAILQPEERHEPLLRGLFERHPCHLTVMPTVETLRAATINQSVDCIVVPHRLTAGISGVSACIQCRADDRFVASPILALLPGRERHTITSFFEAGADVVISAPFDSDHIFLQVSALARQRTALQQHGEQLGESLVLSSSVVDALQVVRDGIIILDNTDRVLFCNQRANDLLLLSGSAIDDSIIKGVLSVAPPPPLGAEREAVIGHGLVTRSDGTSFRAELRSLDLRGPHDHVVGHAVSLRDLEELDVLERTVAELSRGVGLALVGCAAILDAQGPNAHAPARGALIAYLDGISRRTPASDVGAIVAYLLETLDSVLDSEMSLRVSGAELGHRVAISSGNLVLLLGHTLIHLALGCGARGTLSLSIDTTHQDSVVITFVADAPPRPASTSFLNHPHLDMQRLASLAEPVTAGLGIAVAQRIADSTGAILEWKDGEQKKIRLHLPRALGN